MAIIQQRSRTGLKMRPRSEKNKKIHGQKMCKCIPLLCLGRNVNLRNGNVPAQDDPHDTGSLPELAPAWSLHIS